jgi:hypothetical protein
MPPAGSGKVQALPKNHALNKLGPVSDSALKSKKTKKGKHSERVAERPIAKIQAKVGVKDIDELFSKKKKTDKAVAVSSGVLSKGDSKKSRPGKKSEKPVRKSGSASDEGSEQSDQEDFSVDEESDSDADDGGWEEIDDDNSPAQANDVPRAAKLGEAQYGLIKSNNKFPTIVNPEAPVHRIDKATGLPVYKAHLLKVGEGGGTPLCPFDCNCCF